MLYFTMEDAVLLLIPEVGQSIRSAEETLLAPKPCGTRTLALERPRGKQRQA
jgi:hypothetical protein